MDSHHSHLNPLWESVSPDPVNDPQISSGTINADSHIKVGSDIDNDEEEEENFINVPCQE